MAADAQATSVVASVEVLRAVLRTVLTAALALVVVVFAGRYVLGDSPPAPTIISADSGAPGAAQPPVTASTLVRDRLAPVAPVGTARPVIDCRTDAAFDPRLAGVDVECAP